MRHRWLAVGLQKRVLGTTHTLVEASPGCPHWNPPAQTRHPSCPFGPPPAPGLGHGVPSDTRRGSEERGAHIAIAPVCSLGSIQAQAGERGRFKQGQDLQLLS